ncbi:AAA family ATPase [Kribbella pittospori]|uniref:AAA family ATPase n=1 Tax=Kribbella pittospori TaxID=722689 RepID=A0A4R0K786_9ACTN|nr:AAA family ATPase [Kribbella pittospori]TCC55290.1 AAA family ATPase [Kribbella pittospori]
MADTRSAAGEGSEPQAPGRDQPAQELANLISNSDAKGKGFWRRRRRKSQPEPAAQPAAEPTAPPAPEPAAQPAAEPAAPPGSEGAAPPAPEPEKARPDSEAAGQGDDAATGAAPGEGSSSETTAGAETQPDAAEAARESDGSGPDGAADASSDNEEKVSEADTTEAATEDGETDETAAEVAEQPEAEVADTADRSAERADVPPENRSRPTVGVVYEPDESPDGFPLEYGNIIVGLPKKAGESDDATEAGTSDETPADEQPAEAAEQHEPDTDDASEAQESGATVAAEEQEPDAADAAEETSESAPAAEAALAEAGDAESAEPALEPGDAQSADAAAVVSGEDAAAEASQDGAESGVSARAKKPEDGAAAAEGQEAGGEQEPEQDAAHGSSDGDPVAEAREANADGSSESAPAAEASAEESSEGGRAAEASAEESSESGSAAGADAEEVGDDVPAEDSHDGGESEDSTAAAGQSEDGTERSDASDAAERSAEGASEEAAAGDGVSETSAEAVAGEDTSQEQEADEEQATDGEQATGGEQESDEAPAAEAEKAGEDASERGVAAGDAEASDESGPESAAAAAQPEGEQDTEAAAQDPGAEHGEVAEQDGEAAGEQGDAVAGGQDGEAAGERDAGAAAGERDEAGEPEAEEVEELTAEQLAERLAAEQAAMALITALMKLRGALATSRLPIDVVGADEARQQQKAMLDQLDDYILPRLVQLEAPVLAVVGGSTGAGKSTLVNTIIGKVVSEPGVLRPTTRSPVLIHHPGDADWFVGDRVLPGMARTAADSPGGMEDAGQLRLVAADTVPRGLAILDAPDIDSVVEANRDLATQLLAAADLWLFVTTAARYSDAVPWDFLQSASDRSTAVAVVLDRAPAETIDDITGHLAQMLLERGLGDSPLFSIKEIVVDGNGMLPAETVASIKDWLVDLAADAEARSAVVRRTLHGAVTAMVKTTPPFAAAVRAQADTVIELRSTVESAYDQAVKDIAKATQDGTLLRGEVLARWQEFVGTGELLKGLQSNVGRFRDKVKATLGTKSAPPTRDLNDAVESGLESLLVEHAAAAAERAEKSWQSTAAGRQLLAAGGPELGAMSEDFAAAAGRTVREWQAFVLDLIRKEGAEKRGTARLLQYGVNGLALSLVVALFASDADIPTGADASSGVGSAVVGQRLLEAVFGDESVRSMVAKAREELDGKVHALMDAEFARYLTVLDQHPVDAEAARQLTEAARAVEDCT